MYFVNFMVMVYPASRATSLPSAQSQSPECMNVEAHNNIMPTVDCSGFHNSAAEYQRELAASAKTLGLNIPFIIFLIL